MANFSETLKQQSRVVLCNLLGGPDSAPYLGAPVGGPLLPSALEEQVQRARKWACNDPNPVVDLPSPAFEGGQCPGVLYQVQVSGERKFNNGFVNPYSATLTNVTGPILFVGREDTDTQARVVVKASPPSGTTPVVSENLSSIESISINTVIARMDGAPDDCGSPPAPPIPPYIPVTTNIDITYVDNTEIEITEGAEFTLLAPVFIGGAIIAPITVNVGGVKFPVEVNLSTGDITLDFGGSDSPTEIIDENPEGNPTDDEPETENGDLLYGLVVYSTPDGPGRVASTLVGQVGAPELYLPRTGNVWFQIPVAERVSWVGPIAVQAENQVIMVPHGLGASGFRLVPSSGWSLTAVRLGKPPCGCASE